MGWLWLIICVMCSLNANQVVFYILHYSKLCLHFSAYLQIIQMWELHGSALLSLLFSLLPSCSSKHVSISLTIWSCFHDLQGRLKVKSLRGVSSQSASGKDLSWLSFSIRTNQTHSLSLEFASFLLLIKS